MPLSPDQVREQAKTFFETFFPANGYCTEASVDAFCKQISPKASLDLESSSMASEYEDNQLLVMNGKDSDHG